MGFISGFELGVASTMLVLLAATVCFCIVKKNGNSAARLILSTRRLQNLLTELMSKADELDQQSKYVNGGLHPELSQKLAKACEDLVLLGDAVKVIETRISQRELDLARKDLLISLGAADKISSEIQEIRSSIQTNS